MNVNVVYAIFKRNFVSYFSNPTGYVFLCVFVLLSGLAAFWPNDFFNANLANLDQLNKYLPYIMLVFIPAVTMGIWAEERRLGTDELLLTIPASDFDVVIGKYKAAAAIFSVSLLFSAISNYCVLAWLGSPDFGLFAGMYFGYWMVGLAMLSIGMVASFLTTNLTVGFILGMLFNAPLVFLANADAILPADWASRVSRWSISGQFRDFGRGVISLSSVAYFALISLVMLYLCVVLIGRRHWSGGRDGRSMIGHYVVRAMALTAIAVSFTLIFSESAIRLDVTSENLNSLSTESKTLVRDLDAKYPVVIEAFISPESEVPESYVQTRLNLVSKLREFAAIGGKNLDVKIHETRPFTDEADRAEEQFDITAREVAARDRGAAKVESVYLGVVFTCGLDKVVIPFFDRGLPPEYELVRSISTVSHGEADKRKKLGLLKTFSGLNGGFNPATMSQTGKQQVVQELEKQFEVVEVDASKPISEKFDVLLAIQPSTLDPAAMVNFIDAVKSGQATAIFEDPLPVFISGVEGTSQPKRPPGGPMAMLGGQQPQPKGDMKPLWEALGVDFFGNEIVRQDYNPHPKMQQFPKEFVFVGPGSGAKEAFRQDDKISSGLQEVLFPFPGYLRRDKSASSSGLTYQPLVFTSKELTSTLRYDDAAQPFGGLLPDDQRAENSKFTDEELVLAAHITGRLKTDKSMSDAGSKLALHEGDKGHDHAAGDAKKNEPPEINVVIVADIDCLASQFFDLRAMGDDPGMDVFFNFDNVTFVLNALDVLCGDDRFVDIRKRRPEHRTLVRLENATAEATEKANTQIKSAREKLKTEQDKENRELTAEVDKLREKLQKGDIDQAEFLRRVSIYQQFAQDRLNNKLEALQNETNGHVKRIRSDLNKNITGMQNWYKLWAVAAPPIFPLLMGVVVFFNRRAREKEGVSKSRLR